MRRSLLLALLAAPLLATGCGRGEDAAAGAALSAATGQDVTVERDGDQQVVTLQTDQGEVRMSEGGGLELPADFPADLGLPEDVSVLSTMQMGDALTVSLQSGQDLAGLYAWFRQAQADGGWTETMSMQVEGTAMLGLEKDGRVVLANFVAEGEEGTRLGVTIRPEGR